MTTKLKFIVFVFLICFLVIFIECNENYDPYSVNVIGVPLPDENTIVYQTGEVYGWSLNLSTNNFTKTNHLTLGGFDVAPDFSLEKKFIVWVRGVPPEKNLRIWKMQYNGENKVPLTPQNLNCDNPRISPDGKRIIYLSYNGNRRNICIMDTSGNNVQQITSSSNIPFYDNTTFGHPSWAPDGNRIIFDIYRTDIKDQGLAILYLNTNKLYRINLLDIYSPYNAKWSPTKDEIVFEGLSPSLWNKGLGQRLYRANIDGSEAIEMTSTWYGFSADWSKNGEKIIYANIDTMNALSNIWIMNRDGSNKIKVIEHSTHNVTEPNW